MVSLKPKEGGSIEQPYALRTRQPLWLAIVLAVLVIAISVVAYGQYSAKASLEGRIAALESQFDVNVKRLEVTTEELSSDLDVVTKHIGVNEKELADARAFAEKLRKDQEQAKKELASAISTKAESAEVAANVAAAREEASTKLAEVQRDSETKITGVSTEVKTVATNLEATRQDLAASRRELVDVRNVLSDQIAHNSTELATLRLKGEHDFFEFDIKKGKKNEMQRVGDIRLELRSTDTKKQKYNIIIQVDDNKLEKKDRLINEPVQFLVGRDQLRYEIVVNKVEKDRIRGYLSTPKDKVLAAERPVLRD